jgi:Flp pilus assembly protein TadD/TolB-like protein
MADIFVSYASEDRKRVRGLVELLESHGWSVWWDRSLKAGETWPDVIERELSRARCVLVVWSNYAIGSHWVRLEAHAARQRKILVPVAIDPVLPPDEFTVYQTLDLADYPRDPHQARLVELGEAVSTQLRRVRRRKLMPWAAALLLALLPLAGGVCWRTGECFDFVVREAAAPAARIPPPENSIALLEFDYQGAADEAYLARGFVDLVAAQLQRVGYLVASQIAVSALPDNADVALIHDRLRVRWALDGTLYQSSEGVRVTAQLVDLETGYQKNTWSLNATFADMVALQNQFARTVIDELNLPTLALDETWRVSQEVGSDAYLQYLRGLDALRSEHSLAEIGEAERAFADAIREAPEFALAHAGMCRAKLRRYEWLRSVKYFDEAESHCERALGLNAANPEVSLASGWLDYYAGEYAHAQRSFEAAVQLDPSLADAYMGAGAALEAQGDLAGAETSFARATVVQPGHWKAHNELAMFLVRRDRDEAAIARFELALEMVPDNSAVLNNLGAALTFSDKLGLAVQVFDRSLKIGEDASVYNNLGNVYYLLHDLVGAVQAYERAVELSPDDYRIHANLADGLALLEDGRARRHYELALRFAEQALSVNPENADALANAGAFHAAFGNEQQALALARQAIEASPDDPEVRRVAAVTYLRLGEPEGAIDQIARAVELGYPQSMLERDPMFEELSRRKNFLESSAQTDVIWLEEIVK